MNQQRLIKYELFKYGDDWLQAVNFSNSFLNLIYIKKK